MAAAALALAMSRPDGATQTARMQHEPQIVLYSFPLGVVLYEFSMILLVVANQDRIYHKSRWKDYL